MTESHGASAPTLDGLSYPRLSARTQGFRLGSPRAVTVAADGSRIAFVRSDSAGSAVNSLICVDVTAAGLQAERVVVDPRAVLGADEDLPPEERARRRTLEFRSRGEAITEAEVLADILRRDERDRNRAAAPLVQAPDAHLLDTTTMGIEAVLKAALELVERARKR